MTGSKLGVGFIGSGFVTKFHLEAWRGVRDADVLGVYSPNGAHAEAAAARARELRVGIDSYLPLVAQGLWNP
jgi:ornithine cyclodeaminase/alanine dehydrogenase-like protein (mu-crystallin family)